MRRLACSEDQIISFCDVVTAGNDKAQLIPAMKAIKDNTGQQIDVVLADADYGNFDSFEYMGDNNICGYVPYRDMNSTFNDKTYHSCHFKYDAEADKYICPANQTLDFTKTRIDKRDNKEFRL